jgi:pimeloyl-ACP methyl ester carboxylesterase
MKIAYDLHDPPIRPDKSPKGPRENAPPILFLHGLFGSKKNNRGISKYAGFILSSR